MKKLLSLLALATVLASFGAMAQDDSNDYDQAENIGRGDVRVTSDAGTGRAVWATVYAGALIYDAGCVQPGQNIILKVNSSSTRIRYHLRAEYKENMDCSGGTVNDVSSGEASISDYGIEGVVNRDGIVSFH